MNTATATQYNQTPSKILRDAKRGVTTEITDRGHPVAAVVPQPSVTTGAELGRRLAAMKPQPETAAAVAAVIKGLDEAN